MSRAIYKMKKYGKNEVKNIELTIRGAGQEHLHYLFGEDLIEYEGDSYFLDVAEKRIKSLNLNRVVRKDAVYLVDTMITASKDFFEGLDEEEIKQFFNKCFVALSEFFNNGKSKLRSTYPNENVVSAVVILGENPCLHFSFVPVTTEGKLSAKKIVSTKMLFSLRKYLFETVWADHGLSENRKSELENSKTELEKNKTELENSEKAINLISFEKELISSTNNLIVEENKGLRAELIDLKKLINKPKGDDTIDTIRSENIDLMFALDDLRIENKELQKKIEKLEMKNVLPIDGKSWTAVLMHELTLLRLSYDFLLRTYVARGEDVDTLPESKGKDCLRQLSKFYKDKEFKG